MAPDLGHEVALDFRALEYLNACMRMAPFSDQSPGKLLSAYLSPLGIGGRREFGSAKLISSFHYTGLPPLTGGVLRTLTLKLPTRKVTVRAIKFTVKLCSFRQSVPVFCLRQNLKPMPNAKRACRQHSIKAPRSACVF